MNKIFKDIWNNSVSTLGDETHALFEQCLEETKKRKGQDNSACYELLRRAFDDADDSAWSYAFQYLNKRVQIFLRGQGARVPPDELFVASNVIIANIWRVKKGQFAADFPTLMLFLGYVKTSTKYHVWQSNKKAQTEPFELPDNATLEATEAIEQYHSIEDRLVRDEFWQGIYQHLTDIARDEGERVRYRVYIDLRYRFGVANQRILELHPKLWETADMLRVDRQRIMRNLRQVVDPD